MSKVKLYIAQTEDGFIAGKNGDMSFLNNAPVTDESVKRYEEFLEGIDIIIMASNTYDQIISELSPDSWPYIGKKTYVFSKVAKEKKYDDIYFISGPVEQVIDDIKAEAKKDIWLLGGANIAQQFHFKNLIDEYIITTLPINLHEGIDLFANGIHLSKLKKISHNKHGNFKEDVYKK